MKKNNGVRDAGNGRPRRSPLQAERVSVQFAAGREILVGATVLGHPRFSPKSCRAAVIFAVFVVPLFLYCIYPVYDGAIDLEEQQSVWQYLNVYSIYQDRLPAECGDYTPYDLFNIINDTLGRGRYTEYVDDRQDGGAVGLYAQKASDDMALAITESTAYIRISTFSDTALLDRFNALRHDLMRFPNIIIDLRGNGGGFLYVTDSIIGEFLPTGAEYIKTRRRAYDDKNLVGKTVEWENSVNSKTNPLLTNKKICVLINGGSASASEILASALKDCAGATLIGSKTYGKGIGQAIITRTNRKTMSITFMQIKGVSERTGDYHRKGIVPDITTNSLDSSIYYALKSFEPSLPDDDIWGAAREIRNNNAMRKGQAASPIGVYVVTEPDPLK